MEEVSELLEAMADAGTARSAGKQLTCLRGIRGVPPGEIARIADAAWREHKPRLPRDEDELDRLFGQAFEDGLVAIGLAAAAVGDDPEAALDMGLDWAQRTDDATTADALGWLLLGPAALAGPGLGAVRSRLLGHRRPEVRRACVMAGMAATPATVQGPAAAPLRARVGQRRLRIVDAALSEALAPHASALVKDEAPVVRKALRRLLRAWAADDPEAVVAWADTIAGGLPKLLKAEVDRARRAAERP